MDPSSPPGRKPSPVRLSPVGGSERRAGPAIVVLLLLVAVAVVKPWGGSSAGPPSGPTSAPASALAAAPSGTPPSATAVSPAPPDPVDATRCLDPQGWRLVTYEASPLRVVRSWIVVAPVAATGPLDPSIVPLPVVSDSLIGLGLCAPGVGPNAAPWSLAAPRLTRLSLLTSAGAAPVTASPLTAIPLATLPLDPRGGPATYDGPVASTVAGRLAFLYAAPHSVLPEPPGHAPAGPVAWAAGRYVMAVADPLSGTLSWFGLTLTSPVAHGASASTPRP